MSFPRLHKRIFSEDGAGKTIKHDAVPAEDKIPDQEGQSGKFLTTDGSDLAWQTVNALPSQSSSTANKFLKSTGIAGSEEWATVDLSTKQDVISDLSTIRSGAALGATAQQPATTLSGYGITDAKIDSGVITLGSNTITPLTTHQDISGKQDVISDLSTIRSGAALGATAQQPATTLSGYGITDAKIDSGVITLGSKTITPVQSVSLSSGTSNGTLKLTVDGASSDNISVTGLGAMAYKASLVASDIPSLDASKITTGVLSVDRIPATALNKVVVVATEAAKLELTIADVQVGDTVKVTATKKMYMVKDDTKLGTEAAFEEYVASADWSAITNKPSTYPPSSHTHDYEPTSTAVRHTASTAVGSTTQPVYIASNGTATATSYSLAKSVPSDAKFTDTTYSAGTGLTLSGTQFKHSNSVTAGTAGTSSATSGSSLAVPYVSYDAQGHVTGSGTHTHTVTGYVPGSGSTFYSGNSGNAEHNCNSAITNGHYYYTTNGPATSSGASTDDGALYVQSYSDAWVGQIAQDYRNGRLWVRGKNNGTWQSWRTMMDETAFESVLDTLISKY